MKRGQWFWRLMIFSDLALVTGLAHVKQTTKIPWAVGSRSITLLLPLSSPPCSAIRGLSLHRWAPKLRELSQSWGFPGLSFVPAENWESPWSLNGSWRLSATSGKALEKHIRGKNHCSLETRGPSKILGSSTVQPALLFCHKNNCEQQAWDCIASS